MEDSQKIGLAIGVLSVLLAHQKVRYFLSEQELGVIEATIKELRNGMVGN